MLSKSINHKTKNHEQKERVWEHQPWISSRPAPLSSQNLLRYPRRCHLQKAQKSPPELDGIHTSSPASRLADRVAHRIRDASPPRNKSYETRPKQGTHPPILRSATSSLRNICQVLILQAPNPNLQPQTITLDAAIGRTTPALQRPSAPANIPAPIPQTTHLLRETEQQEITLKINSHQQSSDLTA